MNIIDRRHAEEGGFSVSLFRADDGSTVEHATNGKRFYWHGEKGTVVRMEEYTRTLERMNKLAENVIANMAECESCDWNKRTAYGTLILKGPRAWRLICFSSKKPLAIFPPKGEVAKFEKPRDDEEE